VSNEIYHMTKADAGSGIYQMNRASIDGGWEVYAMRRPDSTLPPGGPGGGGGGTPTYSWVLYANPQWNGAYASTSWTASPGNYTGYGNIITVTNPSFTHTKVVGIAGADGYWLNAGGLFFGSMGVKTKTDYELIGTGSAQANAGAAIADWLTGSVILALGSDRKIAFGFNATSGTKTCIYSVYFGYEL